MGIRDINLLFPRFEDLLENPAPSIPDPEPNPDPNPDPEPEPTPTFIITDLGAGQYSAQGTDDEVYILDSTTHQLNSPTITLNGNSFVATSA